MRRSFLEGSFRKVIAPVRVAAALLCAVVLFALSVTSCSPGQSAPPENTATTPAPQAAVTASASETPGGSEVGAPAPTALPDAPSPAPVPTETPDAVFRPSSGWAIFSNPDFVQGVAVHNEQLWAATLGGVVAWDLQTGRPTLYTTRDGLAEIQGSDVVYCPVPEDRIVVAHPSGMLSAYDLNLKKWSRMPITFEDGGTLHSVSTLFCDSVNRRLLVGSPDGLGILDEKTGRWKYIGSAEGLRVDSILAIDVIGQAIWIAGGDGGAFFIMGSTVFPYNSASGFPSGSVNDLSVAPDTSVWFGYATGLTHYKEKKWNSYGAQSLAGIPFATVDHVEIGPDKRVWIASAREGVCPFDPVTLFCSTIYPGTGDTPITDLVVDENSTAYAATSGGGVLVLGSDQVSHLIFRRNQLLSNDVLDIAEGPDGKLWVATNLGINIFSLNLQFGKWEVLQPQRSEIAFFKVDEFMPAAEGIWMYSSQESQAAFYDGETWMRLDASMGLSGDILDAELDHRGYVWFATSHGIRVWDGSLMRSYVPPDTLPGNIFQSLFQQDGVMWVGTDLGLLRYERYQWSLVLPGISVKTIALDNNGGLLLGTDQGLVRFDGKQSFLWYVNLGEEMIYHPNITSIAWDADNHLWVGTDGDGLLNYDGEHWKQFNTTNGLPTNRIRKVFADHLGEVWIAAYTGDGGGALIRYMP